MPKVFLGGTVNGSKWRDYVMPRLHIDYFDPVVEEWNDEAYKKELYEREHCDYCLYVLTPKMKGVYSIAEVVDDSNKRPKKTLFCFLKKDGDKEFDAVQLRSMQAVTKMVVNNGAKHFDTLDELISFLNTAPRKIRHTSPIK
ncbi:nucleoside 2-deoxyribosyltransferase domain-containing protein [Bernardetia sp.]|uniref:nucleoside 2-deoxyribosyltransferase domain-containing protein n=1 Tax=Bernardetia sp. TaxID=1937974 RepID=UPI0025B83F10|nr:nucleoside 2-deoxyribosyltransferase domain-containing protein [Bernardetia sp.]